jgi:hypothetical protein
VSVILLTALMLGLGDVLAGRLRLTDPIDRQGLVALLMMGGLALSLSLTLGRIADVRRT